MSTSEVDLQNDKQLKCLYDLGQSGLQNMGNTCFFNTALQCINSVKYFIGYPPSIGHLFILPKRR